LFFLLWDVTGITLGVFFKGESDLLCGVLLAPELPLEELLFLLLVCHCSLLLFLCFSRRAAKA
jgi:lycopene cyclase domain-containing protein